MLELRQRLAATKQRHQVPSSSVDTHLEPTVTLVSTGLAPPTKPQGAKIWCFLDSAGKVATMKLPSDCARLVFVLASCLTPLALVLSSLLSCANDAHQPYFFLSVQQLTVASV